MKAKRQPAKWTLATLALVGLIVLVSLTTLRSSSHTTPLPAQTPVASVAANAVTTITSATTGETTYTCWAASTGAPLTWPDVELNGIAALTWNDLWAVGNQGNRSLANLQTQSLIEHWDGNAWITYSSPSPGAYINTLAAVTTLSASDVWAVGYYGQPGVDSTTLILHWNGHSWNQVASPSPGKMSQLTAVTAISPFDIWAVGSQTDGYSEQMLALHWDGSAWNVVPTPDLSGSSSSNPGYGALQAIAASASDDIWAVGRGGSRDPNGALVIHWDGHGWTQAQLPRLEVSPNLVAVAALSPDDVWATGSTFEHGTFALHWDGKTWDTPPTPYPGDYPSSLNALAAVSPNDVWAVGTVGSSRMLVEHWDGAAWSIVPGTPNPKGALTGSITIAPATLPTTTKSTTSTTATGAPDLDLWIAGSAIDERTELRQALIVHYTDSSTPCEPPTPSMAQTSGPTPILLSDSVPPPYDDRPASGGSYIFWTDTRPSPWAIMGYDVDAGRAFTVTQRPLLKGIIATDGKTIAWIERPSNGGPERIRGYDIGAGTEFPIIESTTERNFMALALDGNNLYYEEQTTGHAGLYAHDIATGVEQLVSNKGKRPVAADGVLLWEEQMNASCSGPPCFWTWDLHMRKSDGISRVITNSGGENEFSSYGVSGDNVVRGGTLETPITIYSISASATRDLTTLAGTDPHILGNTAAWTGAPSTAPGGESGFSVKVEDLATGVVSTLVVNSDLHKQVQAVAGQTRKAVAYTTESASAPFDNLYLIYLK